LVIGIVDALCFTLGSGLTARWLIGLRLSEDESG